MFTIYKPNLFFLVKCNKPNLSWIAMKTNKKIHQTVLDKTGLISLIKTE